MFDSFKFQPLAVGKFSSVFINHENEGEMHSSYEGEIYRLHADGSLKPFQLMIIYNELYCYQKSGEVEDQDSTPGGGMYQKYRFAYENSHKSMHTLQGAFVSIQDTEQKLSLRTKDAVHDKHGHIVQGPELEQGAYYAFKIIFPVNKTRVYYCSSKEERNQWVEMIKQVTGFRNIYDHYQLKQDLGKGKFGEVKLGINLKTQQKVAVKTIKKKNVPVNELELQRREIDALRACDHPNVVKLIDTFENSEYFFIVLEYLNGGDLFEYLNKKEFKITEDRARCITHQVLNALYYLKSMGIAHRDIKLENIIMTNSDDDSDIKLIDLGLSRIIGPGETTTDPYGTLAYVAPEVLLQKAYRFEVDMWSTGVIVYVMLSGLLPFDAPTNRETARQTISSPVPFTHKLWEFVSYDAKDLILKLLDKSQKQRLTVKEALQHPWVCRRSKSLLKIRESTAEDETNDQHYISNCLYYFDKTTKQ